MSNDWQTLVSGGVVGLALSFYGDALELSERWPVVRWVAVAVLSPAVVWSLRWIAGIR